MRECTSEILPVKSRVEYTIFRSVDAAFCDTSGGLPFMLYLAITLASMTAVVNGIQFDSDNTGSL